MKLDIQQQASVEGITNGLRCPRDFQCYQSGFEDLPRSRLIAGGRLVECLENCRNPCSFAVHFGSGAFCECPLLNYVLKTLRR